jgi:hypothetical protein
MTYVHNEILLFGGLPEVRRGSSMIEMKIGNPVRKNRAADPIPAN